MSRLDVALGSGCGVPQLQRVFLIWSSETVAGQIPQNVAWGIGPADRSQLYVTEVDGHATIVSIDAPAGRFEAFADKARSVLATFERVR